MDDTVTYVCDSCGEEVTIPVDHQNGDRQQFVEDCPVCCCPMVIEVEVSEDGTAWARATRE